jgi:Holliday junction resolvase RusA-like endonuclease
VTVVRFTVIGVARPQGSLKAFVRPGARHPTVTHDNPLTRAWRTLIAHQAHAVVTLDKVAQFLGPVALRVTFTLPRPASLPKRVTAHTKAPDLDKLVRSVGDALTGVLYRDDAQIVELHARKIYGDLGSVPRAEITVQDAAVVTASAEQPWLLD